MHNQKHIPIWKIFGSITNILILLCSLVYQVKANAQQNPLKLPVAGSILEDNHGIQMVYVPQTEYRLGIDKVNLEIVCMNRGYTSPREIQRCVEFTEIDTGSTLTQTVKISGFWIDRYEVTIQQFQELCVYWTDIIEPCSNTLLQQTPSLTQNPQQPIVGIDWHTAMRFCTLREARLPNEAEWEYAASGLDKLYYPWGNDFISDFIHDAEDTYPPTQTYPVGSLFGNKSWIGVYDMSGNAAEWVEDRYITRFQMAYFDEIEKLPNHFQIDLARVIKGGSWDGRPWPMTTFYREFASPTTLDSHIGFRCAKSFW